MKLKQYLTEYQRIEDQQESRVKPIEEIQAISMLKGKCKKAFDDYMNGTYIQRYSHRAPQTTYGFADTSKIPARLSRNSFNYYTLIINGDPSWKKFPRRQVICSLRRKSGMPLPIQDTGELIIFPFDGVKIGTCSTQDMWDSFSVLRTIGISANRMNQFIKKMLNQGRSKGESYDKSLEQFKKACKTKADPWIKSLGGSYGVSEVLPDMNRSLRVLEEYYEMNDHDFYKTVRSVYNPSNFKVSTPGAQRGSEMNEIWFEGPALFVNASIVSEFIGDLTND